MTHTWEVHVVSRLTPSVLPTLGITLALAALAPGMRWPLCCAGFDAVQWRHAHHYLDTNERQLFEKGSRPGIIGWSFLVVGHAKQYQQGTCVLAIVCSLGKVRRISSAWSISLVTTWRTQLESGGVT